jgi:hypothetical protein
MILIDGRVDAVRLDCVEEHVTDWLSIREGGDVGKHGVERGAIEELAIEEDRADLGCVGDVVERIGIEQDKVCELAGFHRAKIVFAADKARRICRGGLQGLEGLGRL